ncbi:MAG TPA: hypothetical protein VKV96_06495, partial [Roseiarcus sp.]|nr:hypothetical protein [Roseiarcus sp.]
KGVKPIRIVYADGGQNEHFRTMKIADVSDPDALAAGPTEIELDEHGKPIPAVVKVAAADSARAAPPARPAAEASQAAKAPTSVASAQPAAAPAPAASSGSGLSAVFGAADGSMVKKWFGLGGHDSAANEVKVYEPAEPVPSDVPLPPRRNASVATTPKPQASLARPQHIAAGAPSPLLRLAAAMGAASEK